MCQRFGQPAFQTAVDELLERNKQAFARLLKTSIPDGKMHFS